MKHNKWIAMLLAAILAITAMTIAAFAETAADSQTESTVESSTDSPSETTAEESTASSGRSGRGSSANKGKTAEPENAIGKQAARDAALADAGIIADQAGKSKPASPNWKTALSSTKSASHPEICGTATGSMP